jgi:hypothetical protein
MGDFFASGSLLRLIYRWKYHLTAIVVIAAAAATVFSGEWFIKPKFRSTAVLYPSNLIPYGSETPTEQMLQLLQANDIRNNIIQKYDLAGHYGIDTASAGGYSYLLAEFDDNVIVRKTEYESVKIDVWDTDPDTAAMIARDMIRFLDLKARMLQREKSMEVVQIFRKQLAEKKVEMDSMEAQLKDLRVKYGILDYEAQVKETTKRYLQEVKTGNKASLAEIDMMLRNLEEKGGEFVAVEEHLKKSRKVYNDIKVEYENALKDITKELTYSNIVVKPVPADKKSYPVRWIIVVGYTASAFFLALLALAFFDKKKQPAKTREEAIKKEVYELEEQEVS